MKDQRTLVLWNIEKPFKRRSNEWFMLDGDMHLY